jgi:hypothetical protein
MTRPMHPLLAPKAIFDQAIALITGDLGRAESAAARRSRSIRATSTCWRCSARS